MGTLTGAVLPRAVRERSTRVRCCSSSSGATVGGRRAGAPALPLLPRSGAHMLCRCGGQKASAELRPHLANQMGYTVQPGSAH
jgi:hypothetical protein